MRSQDDQTGALTDYDGGVWWHFTIGSESQEVMALGGGAGHGGVEGPLPLVPGSPQAPLTTGAIGLSEGDQPEADLTMEPESPVASPATAVAPTLTGMGAKPTAAASWLAAEGASSPILLLEGGSVVTVEYSHLDALGSVRAVTDAVGVVLRRHDFLPFGEEWQPAAPPGDTRLFTGKERDLETGLDYFGARYYAATTGRFTTVDPLMTLADSTEEPQKWNRYAYVRNNPLRYVDPDGREEQKPSQQEIIKELDRLAGLYKVPKELVTAVARTESGLDVDAKNENKNADGKVVSTDYGLMQVNSSNIKKPVTGEGGAPFTIPDAIKTDWKVNANAGVALVAQEYKAADKDQPTGTAQTKAQQTYSGYNARPDDRSRYKKTDDKGNPKNKKDQNFLGYYLQEVKRREAK